MLKEIYLALQARLQSQIPSLIEVDWFLQQYASGLDNIQFASPSAYIEFGQMPADTVGDGAQILEASFTIHLLTEALFDSGERISDQAANHSGLVQSVYQALHRWQAMLSDVPGNEALRGTDNDLVLINTISRDVLIPDHSFSNLFVTRQQFSCSVFDYSAMKVYQNTIAQLIIIKEI